MTIAITGSRGLIGSALVVALRADGHRIKRLVTGRAEPKDDGTEWLSWNPQEPLPDGMLRGVDTVVHLAGDSIASGLWTRAKKQRLRDSRIIPTRHIANAVDRDGVPTLLSGSAVGYYGDRGEESLNESSAAGTGFLADLAREWEAAATCKARTVLLRTGIVLGANGGILAAQKLPFSLGLGAMLGNGRQFIPWIALHDYIRAVQFILVHSDQRGPVNLVAPEPVTNRIFGRTLAKVLRRPFLLSAPAFALRLLPGGMADEALLTSQNAKPAKLLASGFQFEYPELPAALRHELGH